MNKYIVTFHSHFGALSYCNALNKQSIAAKLMPVPRKVSSSCGTCVYYEHSSVADLGELELDSVYIEVNNALQCIFRK